MKGTTSKFTTVDTQQDKKQLDDSQKPEDTLCLNNFTLKLNNSPLEDTDYSKLECYKIILETELGDALFANLYRIIDNNVDVDKTSYEEENLVKKLREELFELEEDKIDMCIKKVPDVFSLVVKERIALFNANK